MSLRAALYPRVSTDMQRDNYSVPSQIKAMLQVCEERAYKPVGDHWVSPEDGKDCAAGEGVPAFVEDYTSLEIHRPEFERLIAYISRYGADVVLVLSVDRLARDPYIRETLEREIEKLGSRVEYVQGNYDDTPEGEVRKDLDSTFAKWENAKRTERCTRGKKQKAASGKFVGGRAPYGYKIDPDAPCGLSIEESEAQVVRFIFDQFVNKMQSLHQIAESLNTKGIPAAQGGSWWDSAVRKILDRDLYIGRAYFNKNKRIDKRRIRMRDKGEWIAFAVPPILVDANGQVQEYLVSGAQERFEINSVCVRKQTKRDYLLSKMVFCEHCQRVYGVETHKAGRNRRAVDAQSYRHRIKQGHCLNKTISARVLEAQVWQQIQTVLLNPDNLRSGYMAQLEKQQALTNRQQELVKTMEERLSKLEKTRRNLTISYNDPDIDMSKAEFLSLREPIDKEMNDLVNQIGTLKREIHSVCLPEHLETLEVYARRISEKLLSGQEPSFEVKRKMLELLHIQVWISESGELRITGWLNLESQDVQDVGETSGGAGGYSTQPAHGWQPRGRQDAARARHAWHSAGAHSE